MEMSNVQRIQSLVAEFTAAVTAENYTPPKEKWDALPYTFLVATQMKNFGAAISHNQELYQGSFLKHVRACAKMLPQIEATESTRQVLQSIPGLVLNAQ